ncbi:MAG: PQQ-binding-like beta-propeller repeat protein, partial [Holophagales bacterium]|nr:PQQ-binding-like beta-propeller repeat protein [Holophagales bacterium]
AAEARTLPPWPGFRGGGRGLTAPGDLPERWSEEEGVAWRVAVPGYGQSSPVIWGGQVFLTSVEGPKKETLILSSLETGTGEVRWRRLFEASQEIDNTEMMSRGAPTPVVDAERIYAFWESGDVIALDHRGETLWRRSLTREYGDFQGNHGVASSPVLAGGSLMIQVTHEGPSYLLALDPVTGKNRWKADRPPGVAWTTPVVATGPGARGDGGEVLISSAAGRVEALDAATGERLWHLEGIEKNNVPSPTVTPELVLVASSEAGQSLALRRGGRGELSEEQILWRAEGVSSGFNSPVLAGGCALFLNRSGALTCLDAESGEERWTHRLPETAWATPVVAGERVYVFTQKGKAVVLRPDADGPGIVAENPVPLDGTVYGVAATRGLLVARSGTEAVALVGTPPTGETPTTAVAATSGPSAEPSKADTSD